MPLEKVFDPDYVIQTLHYLLKGNPGLEIIRKGKDKIIIHSEYVVAYLIYNKEKDTTPIKFWTCFVNGKERRIKDPVSLVQSQSEIAKTMRESFKELVRKDAKVKLP